MSAFTSALESLQPNQGLMELALCKMSVGDIVEDGQYRVVSIVRIYWYTPISGDAPYWAITFVGEYIGDTV